MLRNYLLVAFRNLRRAWGYAAINVAGLAVGLACCLLIGLFVRHELSYDRFNARADRVYRVVQEQRFGATQQVAVTSGPLAPALEADVPEVEETARVFFSQDLLYRDEEPTVEATVAFADPAVFDVFTFPLTRGDRARVLAEPNTVVLSERLAHEVFGDADPVGRLVHLRGDEVLRVTGLMRDVPSNSHLQFDALASFASRKEEWLEEWGANALTTYVLLREGATPEAVEARLPGLAVAHRGAEDAEGITFYLQPLTSLHFQQGMVADSAVVGDRSVVLVFAAIAVFILLIASVNYVNLATARSMRRMREVGVRKALGAPRSQLVRQFLGESFVTAAVALALGVGLALAALPLFNQLLGQALSFGGVPVLLWAGALPALFVFVGLLAGLYPALHLSRFRPVVVLKGTLPALTGGAGFRRVLVVGQFAVSVALIAAVGVAYQQLTYIRTAHLGFDTEQLVALGRSDDDTARLKAALGAHPEVRAAAASRAALGDFLAQTTFYREGTSEDEALLMSYLAVDPDFIPTTGMTMAAGRNFSEDHPTDSTLAVILNETGARALGFPSAAAAVGGRVGSEGDEMGEVIGVVRDFHFASLHQVIEPQMFVWQPTRLRVLTARLRPGDVGSSLAALEAAWASVIPDRPFSYTFVDDRLAELYQGDARLGLLFGVFALLAVTIACLGLFGLAAFTAERRTKEIGVRKVLGATGAGIATLLSKDFLALVAVGAVLAVPAAYLGMKRWLEGFAYHVDIGPGVFLLAGALALVIALATVSVQALRAAATDPVKALRAE